MKDWGQVTETIATSCVMMGSPYGDYVEQLTYLLFFKMDDENSRLLDKKWKYVEIHLKGSVGVQAVGVCLYATCTTLLANPLN
jgi:hypothetical protein